MNAGRLREQLQAYWRALMDAEPAQVTGGVVALLALAAGLGLHLSDNDQAATVTWIGAAVPILQALWTRRAVIAPATLARTVRAERAEAYDAGVTEGAAVVTAGEAAELEAPETTDDVDPPTGAQAGLLPEE